MTKPIAYVHLHEWKSGQKFPNDCFFGYPSPGSVPVFTETNESQQRLIEQFTQQLKVAAQLLRALTAGTPREAEAVAAADELGRFLSQHELNT